MLRSDKVFLARKAIKASSNRSRLTAFLAFFINFMCYIFIFVGINISTNYSSLMELISKDDSPSRTYSSAVNVNYKVLDEADLYKDSLDFCYIHGTVSISERNVAGRVYHQDYADRIELTAGNKLSSSTEKECLISSQFIDTASGVTFTEGVDSYVDICNLYLSSNCLRFKIVGVYEDTAKSVSFLSSSIPDPNSGSWSFTHLTVPNFYTLSRAVQEKTLNFYKTTIPRYAVSSTNSSGTINLIVAFFVIFMVGITLAITMNSISNMVFFSIDKSLPFFGLITSMGGTTRELNGIVYREDALLVGVGVFLAFILELALDILFSLNAVKTFLNIPVIIVFTPLSYVGFILGALMLAFNILHIKTHLRFIQYMNPLDALKEDD